MRCFLLHGSVKVTVFGGTGRIGARVTKRLIDLEHEVTVVSRKKPANPFLNNSLVQHFVGDITCVADVRKAVAGSQIVYDLTDSRIVTKRLVRGAQTVVGVLEDIGSEALVVSLSIVNADDSKYNYYRHKAQQANIYRSYVRCHVLEVTQFFSFLDMIFDSGKSLGIIPYLTKTSFQPVGEHDVAFELVSVVSGSPPNRWRLVGSEIVSAKDAARRYREAQKSRRILVPFRMPTGLGTFFRAGKNLDKAAVCGSQTYLGGNNEGN